MATSDVKDTPKNKVWFLNSGCSNHMSGNMDWFCELDEMRIRGIIQIITDVFYMPELSNNLLSTGQLQ